MKKALVALAMLAAITPAHADDDGGASNCISLIVGFCNDIDVGAGKIDRNELSTGVQSELDGIAVTNTNQTTAINTLSSTKADKTYVDAENDAQDARLDKHKKAIILNYGWDLYQQGMLNDHKERIGSLESMTEEHGRRLDAHDAILSQHAATLGEHEKGLAIAMAMPDAWLSDSKRFGIFGAVGGFDNETAMGIAAIGRIDETWSLNLKGGSDTEFKQFGWQVGAGAQW